jgi:membrane-bound inhibitor of C-type lysozyme
MNNRKLWAIIGIVILIIIAIIIGVSAKAPEARINNDDGMYQVIPDEVVGNSSNDVINTTGSEGTVAASISSQTPVFYACQNNKKLSATYSNTQATVKLTTGQVIYMKKSLSSVGNEYTYKQMILTVDGTSATMTDAGSLTYSNCTVINSGTNQDKAVFTNKAKTFSFNYPKTLTISGDQTDPNGTGPIVTKVTITKDSQPKTNLGDSTFIVTSDSSKSSADSCIADPSGNLSQKSSVTINGTKFTKLTSTEAAAGNRYETATYIASKDNICYTIESTVHWSVIENYAPNTGIVNFNKSKVQSVLDGMINSFKFL